MAHLLPNHVIGLKGSLKDSIHFMDDTTYFFVSGHSLVVASTESKQQKLLPGTNDTSAITAVALSPTKKLLAVAESALPSPAALQAEAR